MKTLSEIQHKVTACNSCGRLRTYCKKVARVKRRAYLDETYWGKPVPGFGDPRARLLIIGLAPAAHGANRTGRIFTGDRSGEWLYRALHKAGFANQPGSLTREDGLVLKDAYVTCVVRCAPPDNKPDPKEIERCLPFLQAELRAQTPRVILTLGQIALKGAWTLLAPGTRLPRFGHGAESEIPGHSKTRLLCSYHPSQQNTFTGRLTEPMFDGVFARAREIISS